MKRYNQNRQKFRFNQCKDRGSSMRNRLVSLSSGQGIYRSRKGLFMGVCRGLADHFNFSVLWFRIIVIVLFMFTGFWPVGVMYIVAGLILKVEPVSPLHDEKDQEFYDTYTHSRESAIQRVRRKFENIERRIQQMEHTVTSKEFNWK
ncbi:MAG: envelope stress response membrane protein PspC [Pseudomonadota bacterium]